MELWEKAALMNQKSNSPGMARFNAVLHDVLQVSKGDMARMLAEERAATVGKPPPSDLRQRCIEAVRIV